MRRPGLTLSRLTLLSFSLSLSLSLHTPISFSIPIQWSMYGSTKIHLLFSQWKPMSTWEDLIMEQWTISNLLFNLVSLSSSPLWKLNWFEPDLFVWFINSRYDMLNKPVWVHSPKLSYIVLGRFNAMKLYALIIVLVQGQEDKFLSISW